ncbi:PP2C family protein-serine/threonine phosphatase [Mongoliitalea daihaiensis]|uniref:PP2C family protein-serine/threonine phosphatase n=1 Tax=Mongoliitalea daihaiensis TaxID=2782006 RepID=UPI001F1DA90C|nr:PP2C family protein-serine/threonine phosphatase [Mongoliitalea daihaiensis]UJP65179.1 PP2C family protein-serine/threonine phosphatase [Mongoliitalea daihaiensis]
MTLQTEKYHKKELELKALLEITQAINENKPANVLLDIFKFTCLVHLNIKSILLYMQGSESYEKKLAHGVKGVVPEFIPRSSVTYDKSAGTLNLEVDQGYSFGELENYLPVFHKDNMLAILFLRKKDPELELDLDFTQALTNILVVALENKRFAKKQLEQERLNREVEIASNVQRMLFPAQLPKSSPLHAKVTYVPHSTVGGDYYDLIHKSKDEVFFCIADVSGKGMPAALLMSNFQAALRTLLRSSSDLQMIVEQLNYTLFENTKGERFITFFLGYYNYKERKLSYINAGHNPPVLCWEKENRSELLGAGTTILGAFEELPFLEVGSREHLKGFTIHLYTDGLTESMNPQEEEYGDHRFMQFVKKRLHLNPDEFHALFFQELKGFNQGAPQRDDVTMLSIQFS